MLTEPRLALMLAPHLLRSTNRVAIAGGVAVALAFSWIPLAAGIGLELADAATMLRFALFGMVIGLAFVLDDPATSTIATLPTPRYVLVVLRLAPVTVLAAAVWVVAWLGCRLALDPQVRPLLPLGGLLLEGLALLAVAFWLAGTRWGNDAARGGVLAAPAVVLLLIAAALLPESAAVFPPPGTDRWDDSRLVWGVMLAVGLAGLTWMSHEPTPRSRPAATSVSSDKERVKN
ncbi:hypothetical protein [Rhizomonospora bruguierae]|uniref:hypothetical protein n=1 Tax=Rhizomonospora bruguierae TaxID=1581705 RepID=UPI001BCE28D7|nr:hypothetical protein [Micromonospora sp. NBRC 107566]